MQPACNRLEVVYRESIRIMIAVPAYKVERVRTIDIRIDQALLFDQDLEIAFLIMGFDIGG